VSRPSTSTNPGDTVLWNFLGTPAGWIPWIEFRKVGNNSFVGPLDGLSQTEGGIGGVCRSTGWTGITPIPFEYRAMIQKGFAAGWDTEGSLVWSAPASLNVLPAAVGQEIVWEVTKGDDGTLIVELPLMQTLRPGDIIAWQFPTDLEDGWRPRIKFPRYEGSGTVLNQQLGPFSALTTLPGKIRGTGNSGVNGLYFFEVALVSVTTGEIGWLSSGDPVVDNRGGVVAPPD
jgi:hypothetical protein